MNKKKISPEKQRKYDITYLRMAREWSKLSYCKRKQVGALIVKNGMIISDGFNGTPSGFENVCEDEEGKTKWYVLHAEANAITKMARSTQSSDGATLYVTVSPCKECSKLIFQSGIKRVVFKERYSDDSGLKFLEKAGVEILQIEDLDRTNE
jgi:dCMP deaminase